MRKASERGASKIGLLITVAIVGAIVYFATQVLTFYYSFYELEGLMEFQAKKGQIFKDQEMRRSIFERVKQLNIPIDDPEEIQINRVDGRVVIDARYAEVLYIEFGGKTYDLYVFRFNPHVSVPYVGS